MDAQARRAVAIGIALSAGVIAAAQVGKVPAALPQLQDSLGLSLTQAGWIAAAINAASAFLGLASGLAAARWGVQRALLLGLFFLGAGVCTGALSAGAAGLLGGRLLEGVGFVLIVVSAPSVIAAAADPAARRKWLAVWGCYLPTGVSLMLVLTPLLIAHGGWRLVWWSNALLIALGLMVAALLRRHLPTPAAAPARLATQLKHSLGLRAHWLMGAAFGTYSAQWFMIATWLPSFALGTMGLTLAGAAWLTAAVTFANVTGNLIAPRLARAGLARWKVIIGVQLLLGSLGLAVFSSEVPALLRMLAAVAASAAGGALPGTVLAGVAAHARSNEEVALGNGIVVQCINIGVFLGPPAIAWLVANLGGWDAGRWLFPAVAGLGIAAGLSLRVLERRASSMALQTG